jgi:hypothetical protein
VWCNKFKDGQTIVNDDLKKHRSTPRTSHTDENCVIIEGLIREAQRMKVCETQSKKQLCSMLRFEIFRAVTMKNFIFWDVTPCGSCKNQCFRGMYCLHHQGVKNWRARNNISGNYQPKHAVVAGIVPSLLILVTLIMEAIFSSEKLVHARATWFNIPEDGILQLHSALHPLEKNATMKECLNL